MTGDLSTWLLLIAVGGAVGSAVRLVAAHHLDTGWPRGTLLVNLTGSLLLGLLTGLSVADPALALWGVGLCGGLTTYSSFAVQAHGLGGRRLAVYVVVTLTGCIAMAGLGLILAWP